MQSCAETLTESLLHLLSHSLCYATLPISWKVYKILPVPKAGDPHSVENYRPISLLSNASKILEWLVYNKTITHISKAINPHQFGFTKNCSTLKQTLIFLTKSLILLCKQMLSISTSAKLLTLCPIAFCLTNCGLLA